MKRGKIDDEHMPTVLGHDGEIIHPHDANAIHAELTYEEEKRIRDLISPQVQEKILKPTEANLTYKEIQKRLAKLALKTTKMHQLDACCLRRPDLHEILQEEEHIIVLLNLYEKQYRRHKSVTKEETEKVLSNSEMK